MSRKWCNWYQNEVILNACSNIRLAMKVGLTACSVACTWIRRTCSSARWKRHTISCCWRLLASTLSSSRTRSIGVGCRSIAATAATARRLLKTGNSRHRSFSIDMIAFLPDLPTLGFVSATESVSYYRCGLMNVTSY